MKMNLSKKQIDIMQAEQLKWNLEFIIIVKLEYFLIKNSSDHLLLVIFLMLTHLGINCFSMKCKSVCVSIL